MHVIPITPSIAVYGEIVRSVEISKVPLTVRVDTYLSTPPTCAYRLCSFGKYFETTYKPGLQLRTQRSFRHLVKLAQYRVPGLNLTLSRGNSSQPDHHITVAKAFLGHEWIELLQQVMINALNYRSEKLDPFNPQFVQPLLLLSERWDTGARCDSVCRPGGCCFTRHGVLCTTRACALALGAWTGPVVSSALTGGLVGTRDRSRCIRGRR